MLRASVIDTARPLPHPMQRNAATGRPCRMKLKLWQFEYEFDRDDAKIVVPLVLLAVAVAFTKLDPILCVAAGVVYYALYFFGPNVVASAKAWVEKRKV